MIIHPILKCLGFKLVWGKQPQVVSQLYRVI